MGSLGVIEPASYTIVNWFMYGTALLITLLKVFVRFRQQKRLLWDDGFAIAGLICLTLMAVLNHVQRDALYLFVAIQTGQPPALQFNTLEKVNHALTAALKEQFSFMVFFWTCLWSIKFSLLMFYRRLFLGVNGYLRWWWVVVGVCVVTWIASIITNFVACLPFNTRFTINSGCSVKQAVILLWFATTIDVVSDVLVMILPIRLLIGLRISTQQKVGIGAIFSLGLVIIIFSIVRLVETSRSISAAHVNSNISLAMWSIIEASVAVIVGCLPSLKTLFIRRGSTEYSTGAKSGTRTGTTGKGPHIRLYDIEPEAIQNDVTGGGRVSDDSFSKCGGITRTQEVSVTSSRRETLDVRK